MPVKVKKTKKTAILVCENCQTESKPYPVRTAAPELDACEAAEKDGWAFSMGFFSMLLGHQVYCPSCVEKDKPRA